MPKWPKISAQVEEIRERLRALMKEGGLNPSSVGALCEREFPKSGWSVGRLLRRGECNPELSTVLAAREVLRRSAEAEGAEHPLVQDVLSKYDVALPVEAELVAAARQTGRLPAIAALVRRLSEADAASRDSLLRFLGVLKP